MNVFEDITYEAQPDLALANNIFKIKLIPMQLESPVRQYLNQFNETYKDSLYVIQEDNNE